MAVEQAVLAAEILVEHQVLAHQADRLDRVRLELACAADRLPVPPQVFAHRRPGSDLGENAVLFGAQHDFLTSLLLLRESYWNFEARQRRFAAFGVRFRGCARAMKANACQRASGLLISLPLALVLSFQPGKDAHAQGGGVEASSCAATIRAVLADIAARDLDTSQGPPLNAFLTLNPNAVAQAETLDRNAAAGTPKGPLFCLPIAVKDNFDTYDMPATVGSLALVGNQPPRDASFVERLRAAGAVIVGKTNMDEFAMGIRGLSGAGGRVGNAY